MKGYGLSIPVFGLAFVCPDKSILVSIYMPILFALGLVYVNTYARGIKFWLRLTCMEWMTEDTPEKLCYCIFKDRTMLHGLAKFRCLCTVGFGVVWEMQGVGNINLFIREFKMKLVDSFKTDLLHDSHDFYNIYSNFNQSISKRVSARFRIRMSALKFHYMTFHDRDMNCPFCNIPKA